jgi:hypothetical protein
MIIEFFKFACSDFWIFIGSFFLTATLSTLAIKMVIIISNLLLKGWDRLLKSIVVLRRGWPPSHLDSDGNWINTNKNKE